MWFRWEREMGFHFKIVWGEEWPMGWERHFIPTHTQRNNEKVKETLPYMTHTHTHILACIHCNAVSLTLSDPQHTHRKREPETKRKLYLTELLHPVILSNQTKPSLNTCSENYDKCSGWTTIQRGSHVTDTPNGVPHICFLRSGHDLFSRITNLSISFGQCACYGAAWGQHLKKKKKSCSWSDV